MIFVFHYILFSSGLTFVIILTALFLQTYSDASMVEIGALLMALPFLSIFARPFFCALADRHQAHKLYLIGACFTMALGYGSLAIAPFYPKFIEQHGRLVWYLDIIGIIIGYSSFSVIFSLGDALALNAARKRGISWSLYRVWSTLSWGVFGYLIGQFNETPALPKYVPGIFVLICSMILEIILLGVWNKRAFDMNDCPTVGDSKLDNSTGTNTIGRISSSLERNITSSDNLDRSHTIDENISPSPSGTISGANARLMGALAGIVVEDIGSTLKSSLRLGKQKGRAGLSEMLEQHGAELIGSPKMALAARKSALSEQTSLDIHKSQSQDNKKLSSSEMNPAEIFGPASIARSLGPADGRKYIRADDEFVLRSILKQTQTKTQMQQQTNVNPPLNSSNTSEKSISPSDQAEIDEKNLGVLENGYGDDLQMVLLRFIVRRDRAIIKSLISFTFFGFLMSVHASYFFLHVEEVCRLEGYDFSKVMGAMVAAQSASEIFSFIFMVRYYMPLVGRKGSLLSCAILFAARFVYYGTYFAVMSPYIALITEVFYGLAYGMIYSLICDCATDCVEQVGQYLPELISRGLIDPTITENQLKLPLRATMQGVFSGAFDGLGYGLGALFGGLFLEISKDYILLWQVSAGISGLTFLYILVTQNRASASSSSAAQKNIQ